MFIFEWTIRNHSFNFASQKKLNIFLGSLFFLPCLPYFKGYNHLNLPMHKFEVALKTDRLSLLLPELLKVLLI